MAGAAAQARSPLAGLRYVGFLAAFAPAEACAGAWLAPDDGQSIWTETFSERDDGRIVESALYLEGPAAEHMTWTATSWSAENIDDPKEPTRAEVALAAKREIIRTQTSAVAVQMGAVWRSDPADGCGEGGAEARVMAGRNWGSEGRGFINLEAAGRAFDSGCSSTRFEFTAGYRPGPHWLTMGQVYTVEPIGGEEAVQAQFSLVHFDQKGRGIEIGVRARLDGEDAEPAIVIGLWGRNSA